MSDKNIEAVAVINLDVIAFNAYENCNIRPIPKFDIRDAEKKIADEEIVVGTPRRYGN